MNVSLEENFGKEKYYLTNDLLIIRTIDEQIFFSKF